jgi:L-alanine-DL-glutamate epimerase-like enolase superfamily enzyme
MKIKNITAVQVMIPYEAPLGPYIGRGGPPGSLGGHGLIVKIESDTGLVGWGEGTEHLDTDPTGLLAGLHVGDIEKAIALMIDAGIPPGPMSGIEMALWDLLGKAAGLPVCRLLGGVVRSAVDFCGCMGMKEPAESAATAKVYVERWGFNFIKTKAGDDPAQDLAIAQAIQDAVGQQAQLRPDANAGYNVETAGAVMQQMRDIGVSYFEDPCTSEDPTVLARIRRETGMYIFVNMRVATADTVIPILQAEAADSLMPDTPAAGGILPVKKVATVAAAWGVPCLMHCSHDLGLKTAAIIHIAASTPNFSGPNDTCYHGLTDDILVEKLKIENGKIEVPLGPGLGVEVDEGKIEKYRVD